MFLTRLIKKYPNRRLYDTELSRYIKLADLKDLVMQGWDIRVMDTVTNEDVTRAVLLQIILDEESNGTPLFSAKVLSQLIRFYGGTVQGIFSHYLEESLELFVLQQEQSQTDPYATIHRIAEHNTKLWSEMQKLLLETTGFSSSKRKAE